jgi:hypothetical protein
VRGVDFADMFQLVQLSRRSQLQGQASEWSPIYDDDDEGLTCPGLLPLLPLSHSLISLSLSLSLSLSPCLSVCLSVCLSLSLVYARNMLCGV